MSFNASHSPFPLPFPKGPTFLKTTKTREKGKKLSFPLDLTKIIKQICQSSDFGKGEDFIKITKNTKWDPTKYNLSGLAHIRGKGLAPCFYRMQREGEGLVQS